MKNNSYYSSSIEKYEFNPRLRNIQSNFVNSNTANNNLSFEITNNYYQNNNLYPYQSIVPESTKSNKNIKLKEIVPNYKDVMYYDQPNKDYRDYYRMETYQPENFGAYEGYNYQTKWTLRPYVLYSRSIDLKKNILKKDIKYPLDERGFPSNHSYYESKYSKKKKIVPKNKSNSINLYNYKNNYLNRNTISNIKDKNNISLNINTNDIINKNQNIRYENDNSSTKKNDNEFNFTKIKKDKINNLVNYSIENKKRNIIFKNTYNIKNNKSLNIDNNVSNKVNEQPRTPSVYSYNISQSPKKNNNDEENKNHNFYEINYNKSERNLPSRGLEKNKKLIFFQQNNKSKFNEKLDISEDNLNNINEEKEVASGRYSKTPKLLKIKKIYKNLNKDKKYNNNITVSINDTNDSKNILNNIELSYINPQNSIEKISSYTEISAQNEKKIKEDKILLNIKKKKSSIPGMKVLSSNKIKKISEPKNNLNEITISQIKNKQNNKIIKNTKQIIKPKKRNPDDENNYLKETKNIMHENNTEQSQTAYTIDNNNIDKKPLNNINISKRKEQNKRFNKEKKNDSKKNMFNENYDLNENKSYENILNTISNVNNIENKNIINNKNKNKDKDKDNSKINKITNKINIRDTITNAMKRNNSNKNVESIKNINISKTEIKIISNNIKNNILNTIPIKNLGVQGKNQSKFNNENKNVEKTVKNDTTKKIKQKIIRPQSEFSKKEKSINENKKKTEKKSGKKEEEWDNFQYKGMGKRTYDAGRRPGKKNKNDVNDAFSSNLYIKATEVLCIAGKDEYGNKKTNQDTYILEKNVNGILNFNIFGVLDGHGDNGHFASQFLSRYVIYRIKNHPLIKKLDEPKEIYNLLISNGYEIIANIYLDADAQIKKEKFDVSRSGSTIVLVIQLEEHIICANTGDSRAIAVYDENYEDNLVNSEIYPLSYDCKPELPNEKKRIYECGGVVEKAYYSDDDSDDEEYIPYRVWAKGKDYPGLAMSRSIGDTIAKEVGVIANPQIIEYTIDYFSKYLLMCSDGIWEFINNEEAMKIANKYYLRNDPVGICNELSEKSIKIWEKNEGVVDDITVLVVFF